MAVSKVRVLVSSDGSKWTSTALAAPGKADFDDAHANSVDGIVDLRDANLSVTPRDELMLVGLACTKRLQGVWPQTMAWFSKAGRHRGCQLGTRLYDGGSRASLCRVDSNAGRLEEVLRLPSGGDSSYPGIVLHDGVLWIAYYSSHEGNTNIYLAKVSIEPAKEHRSPYSR